MIGIPQTLTTGGYRMFRLLAALAFGLFATAVEARPLDVIIAAGDPGRREPELRPGSDDERQERELVGFDVDLANKLGQMLGVKVAFVTVESASRVPFITTAIHIVLGALTRTPERAKLIDYTVPVKPNPSAR